MMIQQAVQDLVQIVVIFGKQFLIETSVGKSHVYKGVHFGLQRTGWFTALIDRAKGAYCMRY